MKKVKLSDLCRIEKGITGINKAIPGKYPLVVTSEERKSHNEFQFDDEAVIIPLVSSTGHGHKSLKRIHYQTGKFALGTILCAVIPKNKTELNAEYLYRYLDLNREVELVSRMKGMANVTLPVKEIANIEIPLPSLEVQHKLVESFQGLEKRSSQLSMELSHQVDLVKQLRHAFLREAIQGRLVVQDPAEEPAMELFKGIGLEKSQLLREGIIRKEKTFYPVKQEMPFVIPENWLWCRLGEVAQFISGNNFNSTDFQKGSGVKCIKITNAGVREFVETDETLPTSFRSKYADYLVYENDLVLALTRPYISDGLKISKCPRSYHKSLLNQRVAILRPFSGVSNDFLFYFLQSNHVLNFYKSKFDGKGQQPNLKKEHVTELLFPLPPALEQNRIVAKLKQLMTHCSDLEQSIKHNKLQNETLLQQVLLETFEPKERNELSYVTI
jgi:type I restriction enzyme S subunit